MISIDSLLNTITMYRLVLYHLCALLGIALVLSVFSLLPFSPFSLLLSVAVLIVACLIVNAVFSRLFSAPTNTESVYITPLILALIITPPTTASGYIFLVCVALFAMASKYILAIHKKHLFNPAAISVVLTAIVLQQGASWWVGNKAMIIFVLLGGVLIVRKLRQFTAVGIFLVVAFATILLSGEVSFAVVQTLILDSPLLFFATVMFTEPMTMPPTRRLQVVYALFVGLLFAPQIRFGTLYVTPEIALVLGNILSYILGPKVRQVFRFIGKRQLSVDTYDFTFAYEKSFPFQPGQYMEWTLPHGKPDLRGNRRYFTIASSPTEHELHLGIKIYEKPSSFKQALTALEPNDMIVGSQLSGDFVLPTDLTKKCIFIAGGIGITPYRSMIQYLLDRKEKRPITLFYSARTESDFVYTELFDRAVQELGIQVVYVPSGTKGNISPELIRKYAPEYADSLLYISGPRGMVTSFQKSLTEMGVHRRNIRTDFFPGFV